jgi:hypothetical protein
MLKGIFQPFELEEGETRLSRSANKLEARQVSKKNVKVQSHERSIKPFIEA